jgi:hypothetical protein
MGAWSDSGEVESGRVFVFAQCLECKRPVWINTRTNEIGGLAIREICKLGWVP